MKWTNKGHEFDEYKKIFQNEQKIIIFGAGDNGKDLYSKLGFADCVSLYIDNDLTKIKNGYCGKKVVSFQDFAENDEKDSIIVVAVSAQNTPKIMKQFLNMGYKEGTNLFDYHIFENYYIMLYALYAWNKVYVPSISVLTTTVCNLNCKYCLNFEDLRKEKHHFDIEKIKKDIDVLFEKVDRVGLLHLTGGEPFLYPDFERLVEYIQLKYSGRYVTLGTTTNGTIIPTDTICEQMKNADMTVYIDDYRENVKLARSNRKAVIAKLQQYAIHRIEFEVSEWMTIRRKNTISDENKLISLVELCDNQCKQLKDKKIYGCGFCGFAIDANVSEASEDDYIDLNLIDDKNKAVLTEFMLLFSNKGYYSYCKKCNGFLPINMERVAVAEQV